MWTGSIRLAIRVRDGGEHQEVGSGQILTEVHTSEVIEDVVSLDSLMNDAGGIVFERLGGPAAYGVRLEGFSAEQGASWGTLQIVVELLGPLREEVQALGWDVLAGLILKELLRRQGRDDEE